METNLLMKQAALDLCASSPSALLLFHDPKVVVFELETRAATISRFSAHARLDMFKLNQKFGCLFERLYGHVREHLHLLVR